MVSNVAVVKRDGKREQTLCYTRLFISRLASSVVNQAALPVGDSLRAPVLTTETTEEEQFVGGAIQAPRSCLPCPRFHHRDHRGWTVRRWGHSGPTLLPPMPSFSPQRPQRMNRS